MKCLSMIVGVVTVAAACHGAPPPAPAPTVTPISGTVRPGDRILLYVEDSRPLTDTFTVRADGAIELPTLGAIQVAGTPRAELEQHLTVAIGRYLRRPVLRARALVRIGVLGAVAKPGFYALAPDAGLADALASAGGPTQTAKVSGMHLDRDGHTVDPEGSLSRALSAGTTLDQLGATSGDQLVVPVAGDTERTVRIIGILAGIPAAIIAITLARR